jgi:hypothetical protein
MPCVKLACSHTLVNNGQVDSEDKIANISCKKRWIAQAQKCAFKQYFKVSMKGCYKCVLIPASHTKKLDGDDCSAKIMVDENMDIYANVYTNSTTFADFEHPAALCIQIKAKRYLNLILWFICILLLLKLIINPSIGHPPPLLMK